MVIPSVTPRSSSRLLAGVWQGCWLEEGTWFGWDKGFRRWGRAASPGRGSWGTRDGARCRWSSAKAVWRWASRKKKLVLAQCCAKEQLLGIGFGALCFRASRTWPGVVLAVFSHKMRAVIPSPEGSFITFLTSPAGCIWPGGERRGILQGRCRRGAAAAILVAFAIQLVGCPDSLMDSCLAQCKHRNRPCLEASPGCAGAGEQPAAQDVGPGTR